ncbi:hypothetical protein [Rhodopirellula sp. MGV]|uniref:hypothetical protein n=1 Tax=Rhodopirellula sp. MGV TaxID=2023130 RepID=UPI000B964CD3|nr:hypothetical protein [Rhodopirellula sp. MGV]OYP35171.1 hypothetical protein CGZ80_12285 [Rhodopirellula sp. MGV]
MDQEEFNGNAIPADQDINAQVSNDAAASSDVHSMQPVDEVAVQTADEAPFDTDAPVGLTEEPVELTENSAELVEEPADSPAEAIEDGDLDEAKAAWENAENAAQPTENDPQAVTAEDIERASELAEPFVGMWNKLISTTNWEKGKIISEWRAKLIASGVDATQYSDEAWSKRVGGVTSPHVGRLRRVYERFNDSYQSYEGLYWSHFLAALDWEDAPLWLEGATKEKWSISAMRESRWKAEGAVESNRPTASQVVEVDLDEDVTESAVQGEKEEGGKSREYDNEGSPTAAGPTFEGPDFGEEEELQTMAGQAPPAPGGETAVKEEGEASTQPLDPVQPFMGLPELPDDMSDAIESIKLAILRHKSSGWRDVDQDTVQRYLEAVGIMLRA